MKNQHKPTVEITYQGKPVELVGRHGEYRIEQKAFRETSKHKYPPVSIKVKTKDGSKIFPYTDDDGKTNENLLVKAGRIDLALLDVSVRFEYTTEDLQQIEKAGLTHFNYGEFLASSLQWYPASRYAPLFIKTLCTILDGAYDERHFQRDPVTGLLPGEQPHWKRGASAYWRGDLEDPTE